MIDQVLICVLASAGLASIATRPGPGPVRSIRRAISKRWPGSWLEYLLACRFCSSVWAGLIVGAIGWMATGHAVLMVSGLIAPFVISLSEQWGESISASRQRCSGCSAGKAESGKD